MSHSGTGANETPSTPFIPHAPEDQPIDLLTALAAAPRPATEDPAVAENARRFQAKVGSSLEETEQRAAKGDLDAICRLIQWDKRSLAQIPIMRAIIEAEETLDRETLRRIGNAVATIAQAGRRSPQTALVNDAQHRELAALARDDTAARSSFKDPAIRSLFLEICQHNGLLSEELSDENFRTLLKRKGLLS